MQLFKIFILGALLSCLSAQTITNCMIYDMSQTPSACLKCFKTFQKNKAGTCDSIIANCIAYNAGADTCTQCANGYSLIKNLQIGQGQATTSCVPNFTGNPTDSIQTCIKGFTVTAGGFCVYDIANCIQYSTTKFQQLNGNPFPLCQKCYSGDAGSNNVAIFPYTDIFQLSQDQTQCFKIIKKCSSQQDGICTASLKPWSLPDTATINAVYVCTNCDFKITPPDQVCPITPNNTLPCQSPYIQINGPNGGTCILPDYFIIDYCTTYDNNKGCTKCRRQNVCSKNAYGVYLDASCITALQAKPNYVLNKGKFQILLVVNNCKREVLNCYDQSDNYCNTCNFGFQKWDKPFPGVVCYKDSTIDLTLYKQKYSFFKRNFQPLCNNAQAFGLPTETWANTIDIASQQMEALRASRYYPVRGNNCQTDESLLNQWTSWMDTSTNVVQAYANDNQTKLAYSASQNNAQLNWGSWQLSQAGEYLIKNPIGNQFVLTQTINQGNEIFKQFSSYTCVKALNC